MILDLLIILGIVLLLYFKTHKYNYLIDDIVPRGGYLIINTEEVDNKTFCDARKSRLSVFVNIGVFFASCVAIYIQFGFYPALLFAVSPLNVSGVAWNTGNYYMTTAFLILVTHYFATHYNLLGLGIAVPFYVAALGSTVSAIPYAFILLAITRNPAHLVMTIPLLFFLFGKRFRIGLKKRKKIHNNLNVNAGAIDIRNIFIMVRVVAYYISISFWPSRLGFFSDFAIYARKKSLDRLFLVSLLLCIVFFVWGWGINPAMTIWFFGFCLIFSQFVTFGMFTAERYTYIFNIAFCVLLAQFFKDSPTALIVISTLWFYRACLYIRTYKNNRILFANSMEAFPQAPENYNNLASWYIDHNMLPEAIAPLLASLKLLKYVDPNIYMNLLDCYYRCGSYDKALIYTRMAINVAPKDKLARLLEIESDIQNKLIDIGRNRKILKRTGIIK